MSKENKKEVIKVAENSEKKEKLDHFFKREDEAQVLLNKAIEISEKNQKDIKYIKRFVIWLQIWGAIKVCLILIPIVLGILYLPPFLEQWFGIYQDFLMNAGSGQDSLNNLILEKVIDQ